MRGRGSLAVLLPLGLAVLLFAPVLFADRHLYFRDVLTFSFPEKLFTAEALRQGSLPRWDPRLGGGVPHLAYVTYGVLDPLNLLLLLAPLPRALDLLVVAHVLLAAALAFGLARRLGLSPAAAALAASSFALGGTIQGLTCNLPYLASAAYLPGALWALEVLLETPRSTRRIALLAVSLALTFLAGDPEVVYLLFVLLPLRLLLAGRPGTGRRTLAALAAAALALGLVAIVLLPGLELLDRSERAGGVALAEAELWSLHPARLVELAVPLPWGAVVPDVAWWGSFLENYPTGEPWVLTLYAGIAVVLLAPLGLVALARSSAGRRDRRSGLVLLAAAAGLGLALALGTHLPLHALAHDLLPGFARFRYPAKLFLWTALALALLAGNGLDWLLARTPRRVTAAAGGVLVLALILLALSVRFPTADHVAGFAARAGARLDYTSPEAAAANLRRRAGHALGATAAMSAAVVVLRRRPAAAAAAIGLLAGADVALVARDQLATTGPALFRLRTPVVDALERIVLDRTGQRILVVPEYGRFAWPVGPEEIVRPLTRLERIRFEDVVNLSPNLALVHGFRIHGGYLSARPAQEKTWWEAVWASRDPVLVERALRLTATAAVVAAPVAGAGLAQLPGLETRPTPAGFAPGAGLLAVRSPLPRAHVAGRAIAVGSAGEALAVIAREDFEPGRDVALEGAAEGATDRDPPGTNPATGVARIGRDDGDRVEIAAAVEGGSGWLVLADSYDRGWRARVDGHPAPVLRANGMQRAVALPAGEHVVVFDYAPASFRWGRALSVAALLACVVLAMWGGRRGSSLPDDRAPRRGYGP